MDLIKALILFCLFLGLNQFVFAQAEIQKQCYDQLVKFPGPFDKKTLTKACAKVIAFDECKSAQGVNIFNYDKSAQRPNANRILVFSLIHGDETHAGSVGRYWMERLEEIDPRNSWRVIPILNPDGVQAKTRTNANRVDLNRNFPTKDWDKDAINYWKKGTSSNPRRFPGSVAGSEPEVKCALKHIEDFQPDFLISIHTPLKVLDFDGPKVRPPQFEYLPWKSLGHFPGSLGRYMWFERSTPVLTMELKESLPTDYTPFEKLQDIVGSLVKLEFPKKNN